MTSAHLQVNGVLSEERRRQTPTGFSADAAAGLTVTFAEDVLGGFAQV